MEESTPKIGSPACPFSASRSGARTGAARPFKVRRAPRAARSTRTHPLRLPRAPACPSSPERGCPTRFRAAARLRGQKKTEHVHSESAKQSHLRVAHGRALWGTRRLSFHGLKFGRTRSLSAGRRRGDRANSKFGFFQGLATLSRGFRSTLRDRPRLLRAKVRQLHQLSLRGMGASNSQYSQRHAVFRIASEIEFLAFSAILQYVPLLQETLKKRCYTLILQVYIEI